MLREEGEEEEDVYGAMDMIGRAVGADIADEVDGEMI